jgi:hypothetical protein
MKFAARVLRVAGSTRGELTKSRDTILHSIVHMHCNRVVRNDWGLEEQALARLSLLVLLIVCRGS